MSGPRLYPSPLLSPTRGMAEQGGRQRCPEQVGRWEKALPGEAGSLPEPARGEERLRVGAWGGSRVSGPGSIRGTCFC